MTSVQERLHLKRVAALDKWSTREKLCLASAVACSGDQNWMSVSRSLKVLCGNNRPSDWFSQKSCAVQYGELLENVETPKRKKRNTSISSDSGASTSTAIAETPTESILRKLTQERISELRTIIQREQEEYVKLREEILVLQNGNLTEAQLKEIWADIEKEKEQRIIDQQKYVQWLKEREERKIELQKAWRPSTTQQAQVASPVASTSAAVVFSQQQLKLNLNIKSEDVDIDDSSNSKPGTSPLLTSLLKSSSPAPSSTTGTLTNTPTSNVRVTAPTITNLLTGNNAHIQQLVSTSSSSTSQYNPVQNQPLTGPIPVNLHPQTPSTTPSKSAPTLSMLLENKNKEGSASTATTSVTTLEPIPSTSEIKEEPIESTSQQPEHMDVDEEGNSPNKDEDQQLMEVFNGLIPDNIEELAEILTNNNAIILNPELLEEESILENVESLIDDEEQVNEETVKENIENSTADVKKFEKGEQGQESEKNTTTIAAVQQPPTKEVKIKEEVQEEDNKSTSISVKNESIKMESDLDDNKEIIENKGEVKLEIVENENDNKKNGDGLENKNEILIESDTNSNQQKSDNKEVENKSNNEIKKEGVKSQNSTPAEISDDSSDNTSLQVLKEKIITTVTSTSSATENKTQSPTIIDLEICVEENKLSPVLTEIETAKEKSKTVEEDDVVMEIESNDSVVILSKPKSTELVTEEESKSHHHDLEKEEHSKNEIVIEESNDTCPAGEDEQKKSPSESSVIVIQEDDDSTSVENVSTTVNKEEANDLGNSLKDSSENVKVPVSNDQQEQNKSMLEVSNKKQSSPSPNEETKRTEASIGYESSSVTTSISTSTTNTIPVTSVATPESKLKSNDNKSNVCSGNSTITATPGTGSLITTTIIIDTDEESPVEIVKDEEQRTRTKRDYSRKKLDTNNSIISNSSVTDKKSEEHTGGEESIVINRHNLSIKRLKEREGSESPLVDDETVNDSMPRTRRRYSSTPVFDSIPNSPASSDDKEYKAWKKSILMIYNRLTIHKNASIFLRPVTEDLAPNYKQIVHRPMDLQTIKRNIENGVIRTTAEFQRDVMLMCQNAIMYNQTNNNVYNMAKEMWADSVNVIETLLESVKKDASDRAVSSASSSKSRGRKSNRLP